VAAVKWSSALYVALGTVGLAAVVLVPVSVSRSGTQALPAWAAASSPGQLSAGHAFLGAQCESCHTPNQGIRTENCVTCHIADAATLARQSATFHASVGECRGCHVEHQGLDARPIKMDHSVLTQVGVKAAHAGAIPGQPAADATVAVRHFLAGLTGHGPATDAAALDCGSCHSFQDKHQGLFGQQCADCHAVETWKVAGYLHPSAKSQECNQCHQAPPSHYMMHFAMMDQGITGQKNARVEQCYACHLTNSFDELKGVGWVKMH